MFSISRITLMALITAAFSISAFLLPQPASAHCDTMDGPVIVDAQRALESSNVTPVLKWIRADDEPEIRALFEQTLSVRSQSDEVRAIADRLFFENLVRVHRAGEGAPYTGLKLAGTELDPAVLAADKALLSGSVDALADEIADLVRASIKSRFARTHEARQHAEHDVDAGREFVAAYVDYVHHVESAHACAARSSAAHSHESATGANCGNHEQ